MKLLKKIGIVLLVLLVLFVAAIFLVPQTFQVSVTQKIDSKPSTLYNIVSNVTLEKYWQGTNMTWTLESKTTRPNNLMNILIKGEVKRSYRKGMENLAKLAKEREQQGLYRGYQVKEELLTDKHYLTRRDVVKMEDVPKFFAQSLGPLFKMIQKGGVEMDGPQTGLVYNHDPAKNELDIAAALPVSQRVNIKGAESESFPTRRALVVDYYGDPAGTTIVHDAIDEYMADRDLHFDWPVVEEYVTDPADPAEK